MQRGIVCAYRPVILLPPSTHWLPMAGWCARCLNATGPPGCGKGTQSPVIKNEHCLCHLATGDMLRAAVAAKTKLGLEVRRRGCQQRSRQ